MYNWVRVSNNSKFQWAQVSRVVSDREKEIPLEQVNFYCDYVGTEVASIRNIPCPFNCEKSPPNFIRLLYTKKKRTQQRSDKKNCCEEKKNK